MNPARIVVNNTANDASEGRTSSICRTIRGRPNFHYAVDDKEVIQVLPINRKNWNIGGGRMEKEIERE